MRAPFDRHSPNFGETPAPPEPCDRSFDDPPLREDDKSFCVIGTLDDLQFTRAIIFATARRNSGP